MKPAGNMYLSKLAPTQIQYAHGSLSTNVSPYTITFSSTPKQGNLLIGVFAVRDNSDPVFYEPEQWSSYVDGFGSLGGSSRYMVCWKVSDGTETGLSVFRSGDTSKQIQGMLFEYAGLRFTDAWDVSASNTVTGGDAASTALYIEGDNPADTENGIVLIIAIITDAALNLTGKSFPAYTSYYAANEMSFAVGPIGTETAVGSGGVILQAATSETISHSWFTSTALIVMRGQ